MPSSNCWFKDIDLQTRLEAQLTSVDERLSMYYQNNLGSSEGNLDERLIFSLEGIELIGQKVDIERNHERLYKRSESYHLSFSAKHITPKESEHGADIGFILNANWAGKYTLTKAVLVQAKKLYPNTKDTFSENSVYTELFKQRRVPQWERMLSQTPASVYFFYNPYQIHIDGSERKFGTRVLSAERIAGIAPQPNNLRGEQGYDRAKYVYEQGIPFAKWLVEDFICCKMGDVRKDIIEIARGKNKEFPVTFTVEITIEGGIDETLWSRQE